jgi:hypothetical protein
MDDLRESIVYDLAIQHGLSPDRAYELSVAVYSAVRETIGMNNLSLCHVAEYMDIGYTVVCDASNNPDPDVLSIDTYIRNHSVLSAKG